MHTAIRLRADRDSAAHARRSVEWFAEEMNADAGAASIVVTELVANAVRHGAEPIVLHLRSEVASLYIEVSDAGLGALRTSAGDEPRGSAEGGLGLVLVARLSRAWGVRQTSRGWKTVWAEVDTIPRMDAAECEAVHGDRDVVSQRADRERRVAEYERYLAVGERKLAEFLGAEEPLDVRTAALHGVAAAVHDEAAALHDRVADLADEGAQRLVDRYR